MENLEARALGSFSKHPASPNYNKDIRGSSHFSSLSHMEIRYHRSQRKKLSSVSADHQEGSLECSKTSRRMLEHAEFSREFLPYHNVFCICSFTKLMIFFFSAKPQLSLFLLNRVPNPNLAWDCFS